MANTSKWLCITGVVLLFVMAGFHGSGLGYVSRTIESTNAPDFIKLIFPPLFAHPSIHLVGLAAFGILALYLNQEAKKVLVLLSVLVLADGLLAFYLGGVLPGILLSIAAVSFVIAGWKSDSKING